MTTGAPTIDVIAFMGNIISDPGNCETISQKSMTMAPKIKVPQNRTE